MSFLSKKWKGAGVSITGTTGGASPRNKKDEPAPELTPLEKLLQNAGPVREDGSDKFFGLENFGNTCYCNSIVQALYYSDSFRQNVVNYPPFTPSHTPNGKPPKVNVTIRPPMAQITNGAPNGPNKGQKGAPGSPAAKPGQPAKPAPPVPGQPIRPEDKPDSPEYKKKQAMIKGPVLELAQQNSEAYGMQECTFTGLKDIFTALIESNTRTGVLSPQRFLEIFKRDNEMFRNSMHQDAHEFYGLVLNDVISNVEANARRIQEKEHASNKDGLAQSVQNALGGNSVAAPGTRSPGTGWVHDIFEGVLTSETKCLTCETASQRDETFLDLSIDLEEHSSVTSCLRKFSAEEMLCERNKFHCDHCGGLQEAEKRMKIKRLPKVLALHLKRFKYTEDYSRLHKLFHRVVYPYHLRMFNTTDDAEDPDRMYELYAVVVHIGGNAYHGHYVAVIKTPDRGWLLFDDEMVEPVDKHFVRNFFGDKPGMACAYVLFYQETTFEKVREEQDAEGLDEVRLASEKADLALGNVQTNGTLPLSKLYTQPVTMDDHDPAMANLGHAQTAPGFSPSTEIDPPVAPPFSHPLVAAPPPEPAVMTKADEAATIPPLPLPKQEDVVITPQKTKEEKRRVKEELKAQEKSRKAWEKEQAKLEAKEKLERDKREFEARQERTARLREVRRKEEEELHKALQESKALAAEEEKRRKEAGAEEPAKLGSLLNRANRGSKSLSRKSFAFLGKDKDRAEKAVADNGSSTTHSESTKNGTSPPIPPIPEDAVADTPEKNDSKPLKDRFSFSIGRKKSGKFARLD
ncbi:cysteine proteinase [Coniochaeta ligniaria NRRL 30616]|uniref:Ubiquitin carboxyl-terminal hydrolase n=1 Tax=Coniochaeta ligniaria NRRL 30616 TaxID=1408157 RepID=A0A1J7J5I5_9PEZI|nr:cysteine proteinase [Coniochaeta ligniaria NRRL 30616]